METPTARVRGLGSAQEGAKHWWTERLTSIATFALFVWATWPLAAQPLLGTRSLGARLLRGLTWQGRLTRFFPAAGIGIILADLAYNFALSASPAILTEDAMVLLTAAALLAYPFLPSRYSRERDFALLFFLFLDVVLVVPLLLARVMVRSVDTSVDVYSWTVIAPELSGLLSVIGVTNSVHSVAGFTAPGLTFTPVQMNTPVTLVISTSCSGIYSFGIFAAAYVAYLLTQYELPSKRLWLTLGLGFLASYLANLLRMVIIVLVGYYTDSAQSELQNLLVAHSYAGWLIFLGWISLFWGLLLKFLPVDQDPSDSESKERPFSVRTKRSEIRTCGVCGGSPSPVVPATRCSCGRFYHLKCIGHEARCLYCFRTLETFARLTQLVRRESDEN